MALANYSELLTELDSWMNRADLSARIPTFIALFEARMNRNLRVPDMEAVATATATSERTALPTDFLSVRRVEIGGKTITAYPPQHLQAAFGSISSSLPMGYAIEGLNITLLPAASDTSPAEMEIDYYRRIPALTVTNPTNWLLTKHPDAYLYGTLCEAKAHIMDAEQMGQWKAAWDEVLAEMLDDANRARVAAAPLAALPVHVAP